MSEPIDIQTETAIAEFRHLERAKLTVDAVEYRLERLLRKHDVDMKVYYAETEKIVQEFARKREGFARSGSLPPEGRPRV